MPVSSDIALEKYPKKSLDYFNFLIGTAAWTVSARSQKNSDRQDSHGEDQNLLQSHVVDFFWKHLNSIT